MSVAVVFRHLALAAAAASGCAVAVAADEVVQSRVERIDNPGFSEISVSRWTRAGRADLGWGIGSISLTDRSTNTTTLMLGLRYRTSERAALYADATHVPGIGLNGEDQVVSKVGIELKSAQSRWNLAYGGLGMRLAGDARMTLKARRGGVELTLKRAF